MNPTSRKYPDVLTSEVLLPDLTDTNFLEPPVSDLITGIGYIVKVCGDSTCLCRNVNLAEKHDASDQLIYLALDWPHEQSSWFLTRCSGFFITHCFHENWGIEIKTASRKDLQYLL